ncbi:hypothetical protein BWQ96_05939 [Gracilariopsis chorda]|uniref:Uncharacterized protein n=1 Tax=Gracilariopsis chorda TaxID=448386 RepID=A0A2V3IQD8_9FLOR|nr:hypothetical protein BWQ96_05939 [Gracilariopsis chorda]|eukprot:PXF44312.1 hypothetical protein BWQ96_05939 [Gracilariopsis chorda]
MLSTGAYSASGETSDFQKYLSGLLSICSIEICGKILLTSGMICSLLHVLSKLCGEKESKTGEITALMRITEVELRAVLAKMKSIASQSEEKNVPYSEILSSQDHAVKAVCRASEYDRVAVSLMHKAPFDISKIAICDNLISGSDGSKIHRNTVNTIRSQIPFNELGA